MSALLDTFKFAAAGGGSDPYYSSVMLRLHYGGSNGSTTFTDSSPAARTLSAFGDAQISTAQQKFGSGSGRFDGSGDYVTAPSSTDWNFGTGDFTVETWVRFNSMPAASGSLIGSYPGTWVLQYRPDAGNKIAWYNGSFSYSAALSLTTGVWYHIAVCRSGSSTKIFLDGTQTGSTISDSVNYNSTNALTIGRLGDTTQPMDGWLDETEITKGVARYTADFTPETAERPDA